MKIPNAFLVAIALSMVIGTGWGALTPVFQYSFPDSYNGTSTTIVDLSAAHNDGVMDSTGGYLSGQVPPGFAGGSLTGASGGHGRTNATNLLLNSAVAQAGGFTIDIWFLWEGTYTDIRKLIDYAGTDNLQTNGGRILFVFNDDIPNQSLAAPITGQKWYHCIAEFDTGGNEIVNGSITGTARLWIDDLSGAGLQLIASREMTKTNYGDGLNRPIGINRWAGGGGDWNQGRIFNPSVYLGVTDSAAMDPRPMDHQVLVTGNTLNWTYRDLYPVSGYDIYLDPNLPKVTAGDASVRVAENNPGTSFTAAAALLPDTQYYWRVDCREPNAPDPDILHPGIVWTFRTAPETPYVTANPKNQTVPAGSQAVFTVAGENQTQYAWYQSLDAATDTPADDKPVGTNSDTLTVVNVAAENEGYYFCVLSNAAGSATSKTAILAIQTLVARWQFEGDLLDLVGGFNGNPFNEPNYIDGSIAGGKALLLNGVSAVEVPYTNKLNTDSFTVMAWVKPTRTGNYQGIFSSRDLGPSKGYILYINPSDQWSFWTGNGSLVALGSPTVTFDQWSHVAVTFAATGITPDGLISGIKTLYLNGVRAATAEATLLLNTQRGLLIGAGANETVEHDFFVNGQIDDVQYYNYALDAFAIGRMYTDIVSDKPICVVNPTYDISGPDDTPDCKVDLHDLAALAGQWLDCYLLPEGFCL